MEILLCLADALQRQHDLIGELRNIAAEFDNTVNDIESKTNELQRRFNLRTNQDLASQIAQPTTVMPQTSTTMGSNPSSFANIVPPPAAETPFDIPSQFKNGPIRRE